MHKTDAASSGHGSEFASWLESTTVANMGQITLKYGVGYASRAVLQITGGSETATTSTFSVVLVSGSLPVLNDPCYVFFTRTGDRGVIGPVGATGPVGPAGPSGRIQLTAPKNIYVRPDGNDANVGDVNTAGAAFLTLNRAFTEATKFDKSLYPVAIYLSAGTYAAAWSYTDTDRCRGNLACTLIGSTGVATDVTIGVGTITAGELGVSALNYAGMNIKERAEVEWLNARATGAVTVATDASLKVSSTNAVTSFTLDTHAKLDMSGTVSIIGTPAYAAGFITAKNASVATVANTTAFSGTATGPRYSTSTNAVIDVGGAGATFLPGNAAGTTATGGQYV